MRSQKLWLGIISANYFCHKNGNKRTQKAKPSASAPSQKVGIPECLGQPRRNLTSQELKDI